MQVHKDSQNRLSFHRLPFIMGAYRREDYPTGLSTFLPFNLGFNSYTGCIIQSPSAEVDRQLKLAYEQGSMISTPLGQGNINGPLVQEIIDRVDAACHGIKGKSFFEPGCGTGFLLKKLKDKGAKIVVGCEPGPQSSFFNDEKDIKIHNLFFHQLRLEDDFDCIFHYGVMEHIKDLESFLYDSLKLLKEDGVFVAIVPGCQEDLHKGNFMILAHEHYTYFTLESLKWLFIKNSLMDIKVGTLKYSSGIICVSGRKINRRDSFDARQFQEHCDAENGLMISFINRSKQVLACLQKRAQALEQTKKTLGLWGAPRSIPGLLKFKSAPRIFDGDAFKHGKYFAGSLNPIESPQNLLGDPVDELWILPIHHDVSIRNFLEKEIQNHQNINIVSILDLMKTIA